MLKNRIIPCLDIKDGRTVKGVNFVDIKDAGDAVELAEKYMEQGADELVFLDITASSENRKTRVELVKRIAARISIPFTVGGGIASLSDVSDLLFAGADKISINTSAVLRPELISEIAREFGSQCVVLAVDTKCESGSWKVFIHGGRTSVPLKTTDWVKQAESLGAGEILLTSMDHDGTKNGFALDITGRVADSVNIPVIASGGAGTVNHFRDLFSLTQATAGLAASIFHYGEVSIPALKSYLKTNNIQVR
ncbi:MAG: imidazole glycerol phosphate synthase subunit HisF [Bacteroidales bacterium]|jgi:cyclase|nr:imidazole glycerol phosphate synthase subunit HisF [Bacteroidales bacterium]